MSFISSQIKDSSVYDYLADQAADEIEALEKQEGELRDRIKQLEQELAVANKCINSLRLSLGETRLRNGDHEANLIELNALLEQSKKDQSRYLWMRESKNKWHVLSGEDLDNSIDAAIAAKESSK